MWVLLSCLFKSKLKTNCKNLLRNQSAEQCRSVEPPPHLFAYCQGKGAVMHWNMCKPNWTFRIYGKNRFCIVQISLKVSICELCCNFFKYSSGTVLQASWRTSQSSSLDVGCLFFRSLSRCSHTASLMWRYGLWGGFIRPDATDFQSTSSVIWYTSAFSPCFPSLRMGSWQPPFHGDHFWWGFSEQKMDQLQVQLHLSGPVSGLFSSTSLSDSVHPL